MIKLYLLSVLEGPPGKYVIWIGRKVEEKVVDREKMSMVDDQPEEEVLKGLEFSLNYIEDNISPIIAFTREKIELSDEAGMKRKYIVVVRERT